MCKIKWAIIGSGDAAHQFASQFEDAHAELTGVASTTLQKAFEFSTRFNIKKAYGTYEELAIDPEIDILYIAPTNHSHYTNMLMALNAGKHVFYENSIALNNQQLDEVLTLAQKKNLLVAETMTIHDLLLYKDLTEETETGQDGDHSKALAYEINSITHTLLTEKDFTSRCHHRSQ
ncbi:Oxidoreductase family, NAD-binding Rossmann fold [Alkalibacterium subtropicum]|uniref:Oxidoreductase family, NAD-binding Rossmann fold n=1 Tax=Alkalibacterium subtropicum TaxID=753702 RepID=A0A1I1HMN7_9LACT|nr:Gfo/Idh/MocA family oxidoreductase [Alkalibacterium subtropicum]SFC25347.1 Oxidoreductase family, NAD-binding Rossmann fold [Alkalibacterium subtropicum]